MSGWGPHHVGGLPGGLTLGRRDGGYWWAIVAATAALALVGYEQGHGSDTVIDIALIGAVIGGGAGFVEARTGKQFAAGRGVAFIIATLLNISLGIVYAAVFFGVRYWPIIADRRRAARAAEFEAQARESGEVPPWPTFPGAFFGLDPVSGQPVIASPRGAALVVGPPGSGKTTNVVMPSVAYAPGAVVSTSVKTEVMAATAQIRGRIGNVWWFDPGGRAGEPAEGITRLRWNPLVDVIDWDAARSVAKRMVGPFHTADGNGGDHWLDKAEQWLAVLLFAASRGPGLEALAKWARSPEASAADVEAVLLEAGVLGEAQQVIGGTNDLLGAQLAGEMLEALMAISERERSGIASTLGRICNIYNSPAAVRAGNDPNFDAREFVTSTDTVFITAPSASQKDFAPLICGLLESIIAAQEQRRQHVDLGAAFQSHPLTLVLDEVANTAPLDIPALASTAGGQGMHLIAAIQEPNQARRRWGLGGDGFLTLFPDKLILSGLNDKDWISTLSKISGEYDRMTTSVAGGGRSHQTAAGGLFGGHRIGHTDAEPTISYQSTRTPQLSEADIATLPPYKGLHFGRSGWKLLALKQFDPMWPVGRAVPQPARRINSRHLAAALAVVLPVASVLAMVLSGNNSSPPPSPTSLPPVPDGPSIAAQVPSLDSRPPPQWDVAQPDTLDGYWTSPTDCDDRVTMWVIEDHDADSHTVTLRTGCFTPAWRDEIQSRAAQFAFSVPMDGTIALLDPRGVFERYGTTGPLQIVQVSDREGCGGLDGQLHPGPIAYNCVYHRLTR